MRLTLLASVLVSFCLTACADHSGTVSAVQDGPEAPVNRPDTEVIGGNQGGAEPVTSGENGSGSGPTSGGSNGSGPGPQPGGSGGSNPPSLGAGGGQGGGAPVPEPGTLLLVGSGLAGAALMRRRKAAAKA